MKINSVRDAVQKFEGGAAAIVLTTRYLKANQLDARDVELLSVIMSVVERHITWLRNEIQPTPSPFVCGACGVEAVKITVEDDLNWYTANGILDGWALPCGCTVQLDRETIIERGRYETERTLSSI